MKPTPTISAPPKKSSPRFIMERLNIPKFEMAMKEKGCTGTRASILRNGNSEVSCQREEREVVGKWLSKHGKGGSTKTCSDQRSGVSVVKGIHSDYEPEEVHARLESLVDFKIKSVRRFQKVPQIGKSPLHWWVVSTDTQEQALTLKKVARTFGGLRSPIYWEPLKSKRATRCYNCQRYRHISGNCLFSTQCGRCAGKHKSDDCTLPKPSPEANPEKYKCVNCNEAGHWAGAKDCPIQLTEDAAVAAKLPTKDATKDEQKGQGKQRAPTNADFNVTKKDLMKSPAQATPTAAVWVRGNSTVSNQTSTPWDFMKMEAKNLFGNSPENMIRECTHFQKWYSNLTDEGDKRAAYFEFIMKYSQ